MVYKAIYIHKDYNSFKDKYKGLPLYEITANIPDNYTEDEIRVEANRDECKKIGYKLHSLEKIL